jgi:iron complex outermembrane recepter protein
VNGFAGQRATLSARRLDDRGSTWGQRADIMGAVLAPLSISLLASSALAQSATPIQGWTPNDIVVTATREGYVATTASTLRVPVPLLETPQSIQVLNRRLLDDQQVTTLEAALANISGVVPSRPSELALTNPIIRGFEAEVFVDGLIAYGDTALVDPSSLVGVERLEVAKGPTSLLFGGGTGAPVGGLINIVTRVANDTPSYAASLRGGSFGAIQPGVDINQPLAAGLAVRFAGEVFHGRDAIEKVRIDRLNLNPSLSARFGADTDLTIRVGYSDIRQLEYSGLPFAVVGKPGVNPFRFSGASNAPRTRIENTLVTGVLTHRFSPAISTTLQVRRYENALDQNASFPFSPLLRPTGTVYPIVRGRLPAAIAEWTIDGSLTAQFATGPIRHVFLAGAQYDATTYQSAIGIGIVPIGTLDYAVAGSDLDFTTPPPLLVRFVNQYRTRALYAQDQLSIGGRVHLLAGLRYSELGLNEIIGGSNRVARNGVDPRLGLTVNLADDIALFAGWAKGSRLVLFYNGSGRPPIPETSRSVEGGIKFGIKRLGLSGTLAAYEIRRQNVATPDPTNLFASVQTGEQRSRGIEADVIWEPIPAVSVLANYAYTDAKVTRDTIVAVGSPLSRVPTHSGRIAVRYRVLDGVLKGFGLGAGFYAATRAPISLGAPESTPGYSVFDAQASYTTGPFTLGVAIDNLFDRFYVKPYYYLGQSVVRPGDPRSVYATVRVGF